MFAMLQRASLVTKSADTDYFTWSAGGAYSLDFNGIVRKNENGEPVHVRVRLICVVAANGYAVGDELEMGQHNGIWSAAGFGCAVYLSGGSAKVKIGSGGLVIRDGSSGAVVIPSATNFKMKISVYGRHP